MARPHNPTPDLDHRIGARIRECRVARGLSQQAIGAILAVTWQQAAKYEAGTNRLSAARLFLLARALDVAPDFFFAGIEGPEAVVDNDPVRIAGSRHLAALRDPAHRRAVADLAATLLEAEERRAA